MASPGQGYQLVVISREEVRAMDLPRTGEMTIGRDEESTVRIDDPSVSRRHAVLRVGETLEIEDLGGTNGTFLRQTAREGSRVGETLAVSVQQLLHRKAPLGVGDCLLFGTACVVVRRMPRIELPDLASADLPLDPAMRALYSEAARVARANINVLLLGETGVGKEVLARAIHAHSPRRDGPFLGVNCAAFTESLLEGELFGSERGAFTGAVARAGLFEAAQGGTFFLDEIGELPLATQAKLLRVLEERVVTRLGSTRARAIDVRFVSATNRDMEVDSQQGRVRPDLYFRLSGVSLVIPPLRQRPSEIKALAASFLSAACRDMERDCPPSMSPVTLDLLHRYAWPGNVRELRNVIERAAVMCTDNTILPEHLPSSLLAAVRAGPSHPASSPRDEQERPRTLHAEMKTIEQRRILDVLEQCDGNQSEAARRLGMPRRTLVSRLADLGLSRRRTPVGKA